MIIEFIGTPGAGKTTLLPSVAEYFQAQGICTRTVVEAARPYAQRSRIGKLVTHFAPHSWWRSLLWQVFYHLSAYYRLVFFMAHPRLIGLVLGSQLRRPISIEARYHAWHWFIHLVGYYQFLGVHEQPNEALVLDEGFVHRVVQMNASEHEVPDPGRIATYLALVPRPDLVIAVHAPWELCTDRIYERGIWERFRAKSRAEVASYVRNANLIVNMTVDYMRDAEWPLIEIDNSCNDTGITKEELRRKLHASSPMPCSGRVDMMKGNGG